MKAKKAPAEVAMTLKLRNASKGDKMMELSNLLAIVDFKKLYCEQIEDSEVTYDKVRMFAMGKELKDDLFIYSFDIMNESTV